MEVTQICASLLPVPILLLLIFLTRLYLKWSIKMCESKVMMKGKVIIVTGSNTGIGFHTAKDLAARGGRIILACRDEKRGLSARDKIVNETGNTDVVYKHLNLSSLDSVRKFVEEIMESEQRLDVLVNNAGVHGLGDRYTKDGIVEGIQINHFAPFLLTLLLLPMLKKTRGRIVNVSSLLHLIGEVNLDKLNKAGCYGDTHVYSNSKLCNVLFTVELARRIQNTGVIVNAVHPGVILTNIVPSTSLYYRALFVMLCLICSRSPEQGAQTTIHLSVAEECSKVSGKFFMDCKPTFTSWRANDPILAKTLWEFSEKLVGYEADGIMQ